MKILDLFCGSKSIANVFKAKGHDVLTYDFDEQHNPDICDDIMNFDFYNIPEWKPDVIWASPP